MESPKGLAMEGSLVMKRKKPLVVKCHAFIIVESC